MNLNYICESKIGLKRSGNEDFVGVLNVDDGLLAVVCDGLGGNRAGDIASRLTVESIFNSFSNSLETNYLNRIRFSLGYANKIILEEAKKYNEKKGMATTAEVLFIKNHKAYLGHIGDSRSYFFHNRKIKQLTKDHSLVQRLVDEGYITKKQAENHPNKNIIVRAIGDNEIIEIDLHEFELNENENWKFLMCTDGVTTVLDDEDLALILNKNDIEIISENLSQKVEEKGAPDNYSFVLVSK